MSDHVPPDGCDLGFPPNLFVIGAQKCMTTVTAEALAEHPWVEVSEPKEPHFFSVNYAKGETWYRACFADTETRLLVDASTSYAAAPSQQAERTEINPRFGIPDRLRNYAPEAKVVYLVRDPVARTYSAYWHNVRAGHEHRAFLEAVQESSWYLDLSRYALQLREFQTRFRDDQLLVLNVEALSLTEIAQRIWTFAGLSALPSPAAGARVSNPSYRYSGLGRAVMAVPFAERGLQAVRARMKPLVPAWVERQMRRLLTAPIPSISEQERAQVHALLESDIRVFRELTGIDFENARAQPAGGDA